MPARPKKKGAPKPKQPTCHKCGRNIHVPAGWSAGSAARKHYWRHHREVLQPERRA